MSAKEHVIKMPDLGEGIAEVELVAWHVKPGDVVAEDQVLADVMTDKATVEIPSSVAGRVVALGGEVGQVMAVGSDLIRIAASNGVADSAAAAAVAAPVPAPSPAASPAPAPAKATAPAPMPAASPAAVSLAVAHTAAPATRAPRPALPAHAVSAQPPLVLASPAVRARAWSLGIDLAQVPPSGTAGRVMQADLDAWLANGGATRPPAPASVPATAARAPAPPVVPLAPGEDTLTEVKFVGLRRKIAQRMQEAKRRIPHFAYVEELDVTEVEALRVQLNAQHGAARGKLTLLPFLARAMVIALREFPDLNARFDDEAGVLTRHSAVHLGIAAQTDAGLMVPVLRDAHALDLWQCAAQIQRLAEAARSGRIVRDELTGSTITLTSLGKLGGIVSTPVINAPEVAIVGVNRIVEKPAVINGAIVVRQTMNLSSSFDHRVVDGVQAAEFIQRVRGLMEHPALLFVA
jgi:2-oxoisovalerate dehydrogenase E2 component (dihydrolipoyl transacylase)